MANMVPKRSHKNIWGDFAKIPNLGPLALRTAEI